MKSIVMNYQNVKLSKLKAKLCLLLSSLIVGRKTKECGQPASFLFFLPPLSHSAGVSGPSTGEGIREEDLPHQVVVV